MNFKTRYRNAQLLFAISTIALMVFLGIWLKSVYEDTVREVDTAVSLLWIKSIRTIESNNFASIITLVSSESDVYAVDSFSMRNSNVSMFFSNQMPSFSNKSHFSSSIEVQLEEESVQDSICLTIPWASQKDSLKIIRQAIQKNVPKEIQKIIADFALDTQKIATILDSLLVDQAFPVDYTIQKINFNSPENSQDPFYMATATGEQYTLDTEYPSSFLIQQMWFQSVMALLLLAMIIATFYYILYHLQQQHQLVEIKNDLISNITHELRTPIFTVSAALEALERFSGLNDPKKTKEYLDISKNELDRLSMLVEKVLKTSLFEENSMAIAKEPLELNQLVSKICISFKVQLERESATINLQSALESITLHADKIHLTNVLYNLIDNALKYRSATPPVINIALKEQRDTIQISVSDNGIGITKEHLAQIFDKFFRVPQGNKHNVKGYGLGLNYVSKIITQHQGSIVAQSQIGKGTAFIITLPKH